MRLIALQRPDGYLGTYVNPDYVRPLGYDASSYTNTVKKAPWCWNLWCRKYTMWGLLANWRLTGDKKVLDAAAKMMDHEIEVSVLAYGSDFAGVSPVNFAINANTVSWRNFVGTVPRVLQYAKNLSEEINDRFPIYVGEKIGEMVAEDRPNIKTVTVEVEAEDELRTALIQLMKSDTGEVQN